MIKKIILLLLGMCPLIVFAGKCDHKASKTVSPWDGTNAQLGISINTGNSETTNLNSALQLNYTKNRWNNAFNFYSQYGKSDNIVNQEKYQALNQLSFGLDSKRRKYFFFLNNYTIDKFSPYTYQYIVALGYGFSLWHTKRFKLTFQLGPGYRRNRIDATGIVRDQIVATTKTTLTWVISNSGTLTQTVRYDLGQFYNYLDSVTAFTNKITGNLALQVSYTITNYSKIPLGSTNTKNTDTTTNLSLVYNF